MDKFLQPEHFDEGTGISWTHWKKKFENFLDSFETAPTETQQLHLLTNLLSSNAYAHISDCVTYVDALETLSSIYGKKTNEIFARHKLATSKQCPDETIDKFLQNLKLLSKDCNFKAVTAEKCGQEAIRDAFITGLRSPNIRQRLLESDNLSLDEVVKIARSLDMAQRNADMYCPPTATTSFSCAAANTRTAVDSINLQNTPSNEKETLERTASPDNIVATADRRKCFFCGQSFHRRENCPAKNSSCNFCHKVGHFAKVCKSKRRKVSAAVNSKILCSIPSNPPSCASVPIIINGKRLPAMIDSGSCVSFIHPNTANKLNLNVLPSKEKISMASSPFSSYTLGHCIVSINAQKNNYPNFKLSILPNLCYEIILGQDFMELHKEVTFKLQGSEPKLSVCGVSAMNIEPPSLFPVLSDDCR